MTMTPNRPDHNPSDSPLSVCQLRCNLPAGALSVYGVAGPAKNSPTLLLVHGFRAHAGWWDYLLPLLATRYQVFTYDFAGMGNSELRRHYSEDTCVDDLLAMVTFIEQLTGRPLRAVVGHSWGGQITLQACAQRPDIAAEAFILDSYLKLPSDSDHPQSPAIGNRKAYATQAEAIGAFRLSPPQPLESEKLAALAQKSMYLSEAGWRWKFDPELPPLHPMPLEQYAAQITLPVSVIYGADSALINPARAQGVVDLLPQGRGPFAVADAHHHLMLDQPQRLADLLLDLLA